MRPPLALLLLFSSAALLPPVPTARAQPADSVRVVSRTAPPPGVARVRARIAQIRGGQPAATASAAAPVGVDALDLMQMERRLLDGLDARMAAFYRLVGALADDGRARALPSLTALYRLPPRPPDGAPPAAGAERPDAAPARPAWRPPTDPAERPRATLPALLIERALLETGLFRTIDVVFAFDRSTLLPVSRQTLDVVADVLMRHPDLYVEIAGHTDAVGAAAYNLALSQRRAEAVRAYLVGAGVDAARLTASGYGEAYPIAGNDDPTERTLNRRVEFVVLGRE